MSIAELAKVNSHETMENATERNRDVDRICHYYRSSIAMSSGKNVAILNEMGTKRRSAKSIVKRKQEQKTLTKLPEIDCSQHASFNWDAFNGKSPRKKYLDALDGIKHMKPPTDYLWTQQKSQYTGKNISSNLLLTPFGVKTSKVKNAHDDQTLYDLVSKSSRQARENLPSQSPGIMQTEFNCVRNPLAKFEDTRVKKAKKKKVEFANAAEPIILGLPSKNKSNRKALKCDCYLPQPRKSILKNAFDDSIGSPGFHLPSLSKTPSASRNGSRKKSRTKHSLTFSCSSEFAAAYLDDEDLFKEEM